MDRNGQSVPPAGVVEAALEKAALRYIGAVDYRGRRFQGWSVLSGSDTGELYRVVVSGRPAPTENWWDRLDCNCAAARKGMRVCWHKAAVWLHYRDARDEVNEYRNTE